MGEISMNINKYEYKYILYYGFNFPYLNVLEEW